MRRIFTQVFVRYSGRTKDLSKYVVRAAAREVESFFGGRGDQELQGKKGQGLKEMAEL